MSQEELEKPRTGLSPFARAVVRITAVHLDRDYGEHEALLGVGAAYQHPEGFAEVKNGD